MGTARKVGTGIALAGLAAAAGYYFYASKDAKKNRRIASKWAHEMKSEVMAKAQNIKKMDKANVAAAVDNVAKAYRSAKNVDSKELARAAAELKKNWREIVRELSTPARKSTAGRKKAAKKSAK